LTPGAAARNDFIVDPLGARSSVQLLLPPFRRDPTCPGSRARDNFWLAQGHAPGINETEYKKALMVDQTKAFLMFAIVVVGSLLDLCWLCSRWLNKKAYGLVVTRSTLKVQDALTSLLAVIISGEDA
jgi:hypothetical protein